MNEIPWTKTVQSLIFAENDRKYDKIGVVGLMDYDSTIVATHGLNDFSEYYNKTGSINKY